jgi:hypothetical protein
MSAKKIWSVFLFLGLVLALGSLTPSVVTADGICPCPPPPPPPPPCEPPPPCGLHGVLIGTEILLRDPCSCACACTDECHKLVVRFLAACDPCAPEIDRVELEWCGADCTLPADGINGVISVQEITIENGLAKIVFALIAHPDVFVDGFFGPEVLGIEVTLDGKTNVTCAVLDCSLTIGGPLNIDWGWIWGGDVKIKIKSYAKASSKVSLGSSGLKSSAKASAKISIKASSKLGGWKFSIKASAKASSKVSIGGSGIKASAKASAKLSIKAKGVLPAPIPPVFVLAAAGPFVGPGPGFSAALATAWAGALPWFAPKGPRAVAVAGGPGAGAGAIAMVGFGVVVDSPFFVIDLDGCDCAPPCPPCPNCPPPGGPCGACEGKVTELTLLFAGPSATITVTGRDGQIFSGPVAAGATFRIVGSDRHGTLGTNITLSVGGGSSVDIHTSCSQPIGPGQVYGPFTIVAGKSLNGGDLCPLPAGAAPTPKKKK